MNFGSCPRSRIVARLWRQIGEERFASAPPERPHERKRQRTRSLSGSEVMRSIQVLSKRGHLDHTGYHRARSTRADDEPELPLKTRPLVLSVPRLPAAPILAAEGQERAR